jgi:predicted branched-subunit amino acid permease
VGVGLAQGPSLLRRIWARAWVGGPHALGFDAIFVAFSLVLLWEESGRRDRLATSAAGGAIALALMTFAPVGIPIVAASAAALLGLRTP